MNKSDQMIPVIDIRQIDSPATLKTLDAACRRWGFFQVINHGIHASVLDALQRVMRDFFHLPREAKRTILRSDANPWGFFDRELTKNTLDWKEVFDTGPEAGDARPQWPAGIPGFRTAIEDYYRNCERLAFRLLSAISLNLGMGRDDLAAGFGGGHSSFLRLNYYPPCPKPERPEGLETPDRGYMGVNQHTDAGALTLLLQDDQPGLEVYRDGQWHLVEPRRDSLVINLGDIVQVWSNDRYRASLHRVVANEEAERFSVPFFLNPDYATDYQPLASVVDSRNPPRYRSINWGEFRASRAAGDYADQGEEVQISQYRI